LTYDNSSLGNKTFTKKKGSPREPKCYASSKLFVEQQISRYDDWTEETILSRRKEIEDWALQRWYVPPPPEVEVETGPMEKILSIADQSGVGEEIRALIAAAEPLPIGAVARVNCIQFCPTFNWSLSLFTVYPENGGCWFIMRPHNLAKYPGVDLDEIHRLFGKAKWQRKLKEDVFQLINNLERFFAGLT
jgi:hypothetical protein